MGNTVVEDYVSERDKNLNTINILVSTARERGDDPSEGDLETIDKLKARNAKIDKLIAVLGDEMDMDEATRERLTKLQPGLVPTAPTYRHAGDMLWDCLHATFGSQHNHDDQDAQKRWGLVMKRAAEHMGTTAAATTPTAGGFGGLFVAPVVGPVIDLTPSSQPLLNAIGRTPAPNSMTFTRPRVVDPNFTTGAAVQTLEKAELVSKKFDVKVETVSLDTVGGYINISQQLLSLHPTALDIIMRQLQRRVAYQGEAAAVAEIGGSNSEVDLATSATAAQTIAALYEAAALVYDQTNALPTWLAYGPTGWAQLGSLCDTAGRPLFPFLGAANAIGTGDVTSFGIGPLGLQQIITPGITDETLYMGNSFGVEAYVFSFPVLEAVEPSVMGRQVAVAEAMSFYRPPTQETPAIEGNGVVKIGTFA